MDLGEHSGLHRVYKALIDVPSSRPRASSHAEGPCPRFSPGVRASPARCSLNLYSRVQACTGRGAGAGLRLARGRR